MYICQVLMDPRGSFIYVSSEHVLVNVWISPKLGGLSTVLILSLFSEMGEGNVSSYLFDIYEWEGLLTYVRFFRRWRVSRYILDSVEPG